MKQKTEARVILLLIMLVISFSTSSSARFLKPRQGEEGPLFNINEVSSLESERSEDMGLMMGKEDCNDGDEEYCLERRMILEAHLDYVYTQHHKP